MGQSRIEQGLGVLIGVREVGSPDHRGSALDVVLGMGKLDVVPSKAQNAPCLPSYGLPTLPATTNRWPPASRSTCMP